MTFKKIILFTHLWLGLISGLLVLFLGITGCILAFEREIENVTQDYRFTAVENKATLQPSSLKKIADEQLPGKKAHSISYEAGKSSQVVYFDFEPEYYYTVFLNPYTGKVLEVKNMENDFFRIVVDGHYYLWLPPTIGQPILASATLVFGVMLITGIVLWWPKNKAAAKNRFKIKWNARWRRVNYDMHNVLGFYASWFAIFLAISGLVMGFQWFASSIYWVASGGDQIKNFEETFSDTTQVKNQDVKYEAIDELWLLTKRENPNYIGSIEIHPPADEKSSIEVALNPDTETYWKADYIYYDQHTLKEISVDHIYGRFQDAKTADKIIRMNYDIHVGAIWGIWGKILAFFASLFAASLPVTGFLIYWGKRNKKKTAKI
ncbi:MAG: PepSY-associated TM helix domain-containing protein [Pelobium sp.]